MFNSSLFSRLFQHIFIISTGFAALLHSTWSISTLFNGHEPIGAPPVQWLLWVVPGFAFAFSVDVGQIAISVDLRNGERTRWKYFTFVALALTTYYFQWYFMVAHVPLVDIAPGVVKEFIGATYWVRAASIWLVPALLPLATTLYTFSYSKPRVVKTKAIDVTSPRRAIVPVAPPKSDITIEVPEGYDRAGVVEATQSTIGYEAKCDVCGWHKLYPTERGAINAKVAHNRHNHSEVMSTNGRH